MNAATPLLDFFKRGEVARDVRLLAAQGALAPRALEQLSILAVLTSDADPQIRTVAEETLARIPEEALAAFLAHQDVDQPLRDFFAARGVAVASAPSGDPDTPLIGDEEVTEDEEANQDPQTVSQKLAQMGFSERLKAAFKGSREMRSVLIRDSNKMIAAAVLSSPKITEQEVEGYARMANLSDDVLRIIGSNRAWTKNYGIVYGLTKNPKTPVAISMNLMMRLTDRDLQTLSMDRNVPETVRVNARRKLTAGSSRR